MATFLKLVKLAVKYGKKAVKWVWDHKKQIISWGAVAIDIFLSIFD